MLQRGLLDDNQPEAFEERQKTEVLAPRSTGGVSLPGWAIAAQVVAWVRLLTQRDVKKAGFVKMYKEGYVETAYRLVFPYRRQFEHQKNKIQNLFTVLPTGQIENYDEKLSHDENAGLIAYPTPQTMDSELAKLQTYKVAPFVWEREDKSHAVMQTWPVEINEAFKKSFTVIQNPDPKICIPQARDEFERSMRKLFQLGDTEKLDVWSVIRKSPNPNPLYIGTGGQLMAMLRISKDIRDQLKITSILEPNGIECKWECEGRTGYQVWKMDLKLEYSLYLKKGWDTMACVKPKTQFDWDTVPVGEENAFNAVENEDQTLPFVMNLEWFAPEAYSWILSSVVCVWTCAVVTVLLRWHGHAAGWDWVDHHLVLAFATSVAGVYALCADFSAMRWCIVPWLQKVRKLAVLGCALSFIPFMIIQITGTCIQILTIQNNAWVMVDAFQNNDQLKEKWKCIWENSAFSFMPNSVWENWFTPKSAALGCWLLSTTQLFLPWLMGVPWPRSTKQKLFPTRTAGDTHVTELAGLQIPHRHNGLQEEFVPEEYHNDFDTTWSKLVHYVFEMWGFMAIRCTYRESIAVLAHAAGLRYTGSMSLTYPKQRIKEIVELQEGYTVQTKNGLEPLPQGWELRALKEFQQLSRCHSKRIIFIMFCKLALQMNLQISFIIINRIRQKQLSLDVWNKNTVMGFFSVGTLLFTFGVELLDIFMVVGSFWHVRKAVIGTVHHVGNSTKVYGKNDFIADDDKSVQTMIHSGRDLKTEYYAALRSFVRMVIVTIFSTWLIAYAFQKVICSVACEHGAWNFSSGCLNASLERENGPASYCWESLIHQLF